MKRLARAALAALLSFAGLAGAAAPQLLVPSDLGDLKVGQAMWSGTKSIPVPGFVTPGVKARFNSPELMNLKHGDAVELTLPDGSRHPFVIDLIEVHPDGIRTWFGKHPDLGNSHRVIATAGPTGTFAVFSTPQGEYRLVPGPEGDVLIDMGVEQKFVPTMPLENDALISPTEESKALRTHAPESYLPLPGVTSLPMTKAAPTSGYVVDIMFVVTQALATNLGADLLTRLRFLVARANASYADSDVAIRLRYVHHVVVNYTDAGGNDTALYEVSPSCLAAPAGFCGANFNAAVFGAGGGEHRDPAHQ